MKSSLSSLSSSLSLNNDKVDRVDKVTTKVTMWGTKIKKKYSYQANIDQTFMPYINNTIYDNDNDII
jgi:hypothetical protein